MVHITPTNLDVEGTPSDGEQLIFEMLKSSAGGANWHALHSLDIFPKSGGNQAEADFVVLVPGQGILIVEVKAHRHVRVKDGDWYLSGEKAKRSPVKQASRAVYFLLDYLKSRKVDMSGLPISFVVWFTHVPARNIPDSVEFNPAGFLGSEDLGKDIVQVLTQAMKRNAAALAKSFSSSSATGAQIDKIVKVLRPNFEVQMSPAEKEKEVQKWLDTALEQQIDRFNMLENFNSILIEGIAGTGKTHIALHEAKCAHLRGEATLFICFNKLLAKYLAEQLHDFPRVKVVHIHKLLTEICGAKPEENVSSKWWQEDLPKLALAKLEQSELFSAFDTLIVDEAQDISVPEYLEVLDLLLVNGFSKSKVRFFGDFENQGIYMDGSVAKNNLMKAVTSLVPVPRLNINCRNSENLGVEVMTFLDDPDAYSAYRRKDQSHGMRDFIPQSNDRILALVSDEIDHLLKTYSPDQIVLLSSSREEIERLSSHLKFKTAPLGSPLSNLIRFGTVQEFKGLEALAVLLVEFEGTFTPNWQNFYVGATRATSSFSFVIPEKVIARILEQR